MIFCLESRNQRDEEDKDLFSSVKCQSLGQKPDSKNCIELYLDPMGLVVKVKSILISKTKHGWCVILSLSLNSKVVTFCNKWVLCYLNGLFVI